MKANELTEVARVLGQTQSLLAMDLAIQQHSYQIIYMQMRLANGNTVQTVLPATDLESFVSDKIAENLDKLQAAGIDMDSVVEEYKNHAMQIQQNKSPVDNGTGR
jgi:hypothetical protein